MVNDNFLDKIMTQFWLDKATFSCMSSIHAASTGQIINDDPEINNLFIAKHEEIKPCYFCSEEGKQEYAEILTLAINTMNKIKEKEKCE